MAIEHEFQNRNSSLRRDQICQQTVHKFSTFHLHFQLNSKHNGKTSYNWQEIYSKFQNNYQRTKVNQ